MPDVIDGWVVEGFTATREGAPRRASFVLEVDADGLTVEVEDSFAGQGWRECALVPFAVLVAILPPSPELVALRRLRDALPWCDYPGCPKLATRSLDDNGGDLHFTEHCDEHSKPHGGVERRADRFPIWTDLPYADAVRGLEVDRG